MVNKYYEEFLAKLQEIFMMDHAELDFGIYRIMNQKRDDIQDFLENRLLKQVGSSLDIDEKELERLQKRQKEILEMAGGDISVLPPNIPLRKEYDANEEQLHKMGNPEELRNEVFSHLVTFFSRYYEGGDFLSKRRYKADTYAIPYNGEEVKLHWANSDQYYIKTSEYFRDYTFELPKSHRKVHFVLKDASTEQNNNKSDKGKERRFALYEPEENTEEKVVEIADNGDLNIYFTYELMPKATKQDDLKESALEKISALLPADYQELITTLAPLPKKPERTLLEKHLTDYMAKNSFDYFIHKDLGGFLLRELDFYLKNEVINIDDLDEINIQKRLGVAKAIKNVGQKIIQMLAQLENFQKKLWLKKKFVVQSDYCITLDRVPESLYQDIINNEEQRKEWVRLFAIDEIEGDLVKEGYSEPLTIEFLNQNPYLVLDTAFFDAKFKHLLAEGFENIDEQTNGLLINSENFQALQLLQEKYSRSIIGTYYDPPYNTKKNEFVYKDAFKHSSWLTMMNDRLSLTRELMKREGAIFISCDENENTNLRLLGNQVFGDDNYLADIIWQGGAKNDQKYFSISHEYISAFLKDKAFMDESEIRWVERKPRLDFIYDAFEKIKKLYPNDYERQEKEIKKWFKGLPDSEPAKRQKHYSRVEARGLFFPDNISKPENGYYYDVIHPVTGKPCKKPKGGWRYIEETMKQQLDDDRILFGKDETTVPCRKSFLKETEYESPNSVIYLDNRVSTAFMKNLFDNKDIFDNPKYYLLIAKILKIMGDKDSYYLDLFGGSGTTAHAIMELNKQDNGSRKYVLGEMADYFERVTKPRIEKVIYSEDWRDGKPVSRKGVSQCFKYIRLEQYEDTLNNLKLKKQELEFEDEFKDGYMLNYLLDTEARESLLDLKMFVNPFDVELKTTRNNELVPTKVDMVDTFNYLIGLNVERERWFEDDNICVVLGETHREHQKTMAIWRNQEKIDNARLLECFEKPELRDLAKDVDVIYVNGENTLQSKIHDDENWQVMLTDEEFLNRMFMEE
jgi:adenine-specific DNA-methyltransferase